MHNLLLGSRGATQGDEILKGQNMSDFKLQFE